jgi:hypothetical protein
MMYQEHDVVVLRRDVPDSGLVKDDVGAVVGVYAAGGYEVEFISGDGNTLAVVNSHGRRHSTETTARDSAYP